MDINAEVIRDVRTMAEDAAGAFLWGSYVTGGAHSRSDIDVCLVAGPSQRPEDVLRQAWTRVPPGDRRFDVRVFEELPLFLQGEVLDHGSLVFAVDEPALSEYLRPFRRLWHDQAARRHRTPDDVERVLAARRRALG